MKHVLKYGLMAMMLCGFGGQAMAAASNGGQIRVAVDFDRVTGCWASDTGPDIGYNVEAVQAKTFLFIKLGKANPTKHDLARMSLTQMEGDAPVKLDKYNMTGFDVLYAVLPEVGLYSLDFGAAMPVTVCQSMENSFRDPATTQPKPEVLPTYHEEVQADVQATPTDFPLEFDGTGCTAPYVGKASVFSFTVYGANQYLFVASSGATRPQDDDKPDTWPNRKATLLVDDPLAVRSILDPVPYDELFSVARLGRPASYKLVFPEKKFWERTGDVLLCLSDKRELPPL